jgi:putative two-component system response regulator
MIGCMINGYQRARILVVDDEPANVRLMERMLHRAGYGTVECVTDSVDVVRAAAEFGPDLILLDFHMAPPDGLTLLRDLSPWIEPPGMVPVIMLTGNIEPQVRRAALELGARDFVTKPFDVGEVLVRIHNVLETRRLQLQIQGRNDSLEKAVEERSSDLEDAQFELVERLALAAEYRDDETHEHAHRVGRNSALLAEVMGLDAEEVALIRRAAPFHDVGKIGIQDAILLKPGKLTREEFDTMKLHVTVGVNILAGSASPTLRCAEEIVSSHHERWDGRGYPAGLMGTDIPLCGRIVAVADVFDALTHVRPYKAAWPLEHAVAEIQLGAGSHFDPAVVDAFNTLNHPRLLSPVALPGLANLSRSELWHRSHADTVTA